VNARAVIERGIGGAAVAVAIVAPVLVSTPVMSTFFVSVILTQALFLGVAAASLIFLSAYGGMVSLSQTAIFGVAGFALGNAVTNGNSKGLNLGWNPWWAVLVGLLIATVVALLLGALSSRSAGIYFLMITLTYAVIANAFFAANLSLSGFGGISGIRPPAFIGEVNDHPNRLYYTALVVAILVYVALRYLVRTPFGLSLQGVRDDPIRMASLGYNVALHRMAAFTVAGFVAALGGVLFVWWNGHIDPASISIGATIDLLVIAVLGGLYRLEGAWVGALAFVVIQNYVRTDALPVVGGTFHTLIGVLFLLIILVSPGGLMGIWDSLLGRVLASRRSVSRPTVPGTPGSSAGEAGSP
jgi:branched-chain amino acid transport system permease protein